MGGWHLASTQHNGFSFDKIEHLAAVKDNAGGNRVAYLVVSALPPPHAIPFHIAGMEGGAVFPLKPPLQPAPCPSPLHNPSPSPSSPAPIAMLLQPAAQLDPKSTALPSPRSPPSPRPPSASASTAGPAAWDVRPVGLAPVSRWEWGGEGLRVVSMTAPLCVVACMWSCAGSEALQHHTAGRPWVPLVARA